MKKSIVILLALALCLTLLVACGSDSKDPTPDQSAEGTQTPDVGDPTPDAGDPTPDAGDPTPADPSPTLGEPGTLDLLLLTVDYPASAEEGEDWMGDPIIKDRVGVYEISFVNEPSAESVAARRKELEEYNGAEGVNNYAEFEQEIDGAADVFCMKYNSVIWNKAHFLVAFPEPINERAGVEICVTARDGADKIDDVLALEAVKAILDSIKFKD